LFELNNAEVSRRFFSAQRAGRGRIVSLPPKKPFSGKKLEINFPSFPEKGVE
jgi:hypothetical protein